MQDNLTGQPSAIASLVAALMFANSRDLQAVIRFWITSSGTAPETSRRVLDLTGEPCIPAILLPGRKQMRLHIKIESKQSAVMAATVLGSSGCRVQLHCM